MFCCLLFCYIHSFHTYSKLKIVLFLFKWTNEFFNYDYAHKVVLRVLKNVFSFLMWCVETSILRLNAYFMGVFVRSLFCLDLLNFLIRCSDVILGMFGLLRCRVEVGMQNLLNYVFWNEAFFWILSNKMNNNFVLFRMTSGNFLFRNKLLPQSKQSQSKAT